MVIPTSEEETHPSKALVLFIKFLPSFVLLTSDNARYGRPDYYTEEQKIPVSIFPELEIDLKPVFEGI